MNVMTVRRYSPTQPDLDADAGHVRTVTISKTMRCNLSSRMPRLNILGVRAHQFRLILCGHKAIEAGAVCLLLMVQGHLGDVTAAHFAIAAKTGLLAVFPPLWLTFTRYARILANRWAAAAILGVCAFGADAAIHASHYPGEFTEAALTGLGAFLLSLAVAATSVGRRIDHLAESVFGTATDIITTV